jgi:hypothetical protein
VQSPTDAYGLTAVRALSIRPFNNLSAPLALQFWMGPKLNNNRDDVIIDKYVIMPNRIHMIIIIDSEAGDRSGAAGDRGRRLLKKWQKQQTERTRCG